MRRNTILILLILGALCGQSFGQVSVDKHLKIGKKEYQRLNFSSALHHFGEALELDENNVDVLYNFANAARELHAYDKAEMAYTKLLDSLKSTKYDDVEYFLGDIKMYKGAYSEAARLYDLYLSQQMDENPTLTRQAKLRKESAEWARKQQQSGYTRINRFGNNVNTAYSEHGAIMVNDSTLLFTSMSIPWENDKHEPKRVISQIAQTINHRTIFLEEGQNFNSRDRLTSSIALGDDGNLMIYSVCNYLENGKLSCDLHQRRKDSNGFWSPGIRLPRNINKLDYTTTQPSVATDWDGSGVLYFVSDRPGGKGGLDIWISSFDTNMNFKEPLNLGDINTEDDDITPYYALADNAVYFSSDGRVGMGGFDVYKYDLDSLTVENIGADINTSYNEIYFSKDLEDNQLFSSNRPGSAFLMDKFETCCYDIYQAEEQVKEIDLLALIYDKGDQSIISGATVTLTNLSNSSIESVTVKRENDNDFLFKINPDDAYTIKVEREGYRPSIGELEPIGMPEDGSLLVEKRIFLERNTVPLKIYTFEKAIRQPLTGVTVQLVNITDGNVVEKVFTHPNRNDFDFDLQPCKSYKLIANKEGYEEFLDFINVPCDAVSPVNKDLLIGRKANIETLAGLIPLKLYFDNDRPNPRTVQRTTEKAYSQTYDRYYARQDEFKIQYSKGLEGERKHVAETEVSDFFEGRLKDNFERLTIFMETLNRILISGQSVNLYLRGYASPLAKSEYNAKLGNRRVHSIKNEFGIYNNGILQPYISSGQLRISERSFGESSAPTDINDDPRSPRNSIYSPRASEERRIEIDEITGGQN